MENSVNDVRGAHCCENLPTEKSRKESLKLNFFMTISQSNEILFVSRFQVVLSKNLLSSCLLSMKTEGKSYHEVGEVGLRMMLSAENTLLLS